MFRGNLGFSFEKALTRATAEHQSKSASELEERLASIEGELCAIGNLLSGHGENKAAAMVQLAKVALTDAIETLEEG